MMFDFASKPAKRDAVLLLALLLFIASALLLLGQGWILFIYIHSALEQNWTYFLELYPSSSQQLPAGTLCFDDCSPKLPFVAGYAGFALYFLGLASLGYRWWTSKPRN